MQKTTYWRDPAYNRGNIRMRAIFVKTQPEPTSESAGSCQWSYGRIPARRQASKMINGGAFEFTSSRPRNSSRINV
jgi:hypothetical protein